MSHGPSVTAMQRLRRSCIYALIAVAVSSISVFVLLVLGSKPATQNARIGILDISAYILGFPLLLGWVINTGIFGSLGSCATPGQLLGVFLTPVTSLVIDTGLIFTVSEFFHRKTSRTLESDNLLHINR